MEGWPGVGALDLGWGGRRIVWGRVSVGRGGLGGRGRKGAVDGWLGVRVFLCAPWPHGNLRRLAWEDGAVGESGVCACSDFSWRRA